jgi:hypothetical protein
LARPPPQGAQRMTPRLVFDAADIVGESAVYDERRDALL